MNLRKPTSHPGLRTQMARGYRPTITPTVERVELSSVINQVVCGDWIKLLRSLPDNCIDALVTDPPYGIGLDVWDKAIDIQSFMSEARRVIKPTGFLAFFGQMPIFTEWNVCASKTFKLRDHIVWIKRVRTAPALPLMRTHESIFIYANGKEARYFKTEGEYEDIVLPNIVHGISTIEGLDRYINDLKTKVAMGTSGKNIIKRVPSGNIYDYSAGTESDRSPSQANFSNAWSFLSQRHKSKGEKFVHATMKPVQLMERLIELLAKPDDLILDPFSGSGTTAVAARNTGRQFITGDLSAEYCAVTEKRLAKPYTPPLFHEHSGGESPAPSQSTMFGEVGSV